MDYLKSNPDQLKRLVEHCNSKETDHANINANVENHNKASTSGTSFDNEDFAIPRLFQEEESTVLATCPSQKPDPFYISLFINGNRLSNCIIDSRAFDNVMPASVAKALRLPLTKTFGRCYSMDAKQVPLLGQIKDAQVALATYPSKRLKLTILVANIPASYGMLLSRSFCKDMGGEIKLDWSSATVQVGDKKVKLELEEKAKLTVLKSDDPRSQILYHEMQFGNYMLFSSTSEILEVAKPNKGDKLWTLEFDGSCANAGSGLRVVLISPDGEMTCFAYELDFKNTNNIAEYEALLSIMAAKQKGVKMLKAQGDAELVVRQVKNQYAMKNSRLRNYRSKVWGEIEGFDAMSTTSVLREFNSRVDSLAISASFLLPHPDFKNQTYKVEVLFKPNVPDNEESWQVFDNDKQILKFIEWDILFNI